MPEIVKEKALVENLDENSKKCLKNLCEVLETNKQQDNLLSQPFELNNIQNRGRSLDYPSSLGGVTEISSGVSGGIVGIGSLREMPTIFSESMSLQTGAARSFGSH